MAGPPGTCSLHSRSPLDVSVKGAMIRDLLNMAGYVLPDKDDVVASNSTPSADARYLALIVLGIYLFYLII